MCTLVLRGAPPFKSPHTIGFIILLLIFCSSFFLLVFFVLYLLGFYFHGTTLRFKVLQTSYSETKLLSHGKRKSGRLHETRNIRVLRTYDA